MNWRNLAFLAIVGFGAWQYWSDRPVKVAPGVTVSAEPRQNDAGSAEFVHKGYTIAPLQTFDIEARVLGVKSYRTGREADLSPVDLALGWGRMSDSAVLEQVDISQGNRFYFWHVKEFPIPREEIERSSANMHMIPADSGIERRLDQVREGQRVRIQGWLVEARGHDGWRWRSSLSRNDTGAGACEVIYVRDIAIL